MKFIAPLALLIVVAVGLLRVSVALGAVASRLDASSRTLVAASRLAGEFGGYAREPAGAQERIVGRARELGGSVDSRADGLSVVRVPVNNDTGRTEAVEIRVMNGRVVGLRIHDTGSDRESDQIGN
jgi:hypothetical protein